MEQCGNLSASVKHRKASGCFPTVGKNLFGTVLRPSFGSFMKSRKSSEAKMDSDSDDAFADMRQKYIEFADITSPSRPIRELRKMGKRNPFRIANLSAILGKKGLKGWFRFDMGTFENIYSQAKLYLIQEGRGMRCQVDPKDQLALTFHYFAHSHTLQSIQSEIKSVCEITIRSLHDMIHRSMSGLFKFIEAEGMPADPRRVLTDRKFRFFPHLKFVLDGVNVPIQLPHADAKPYISRIKGISFKSVVTTTREGWLVHQTETRKGAEHDMKTLVLGKGIGCGVTLKEFMTVEGRKKIPVAADGGFRGIDKLLPRSMVPHRRVRGVVTPAQQGENRRFGRQRIIIENFFARAKGLWKIIAVPYRGKVENMQYILPCCIWLTNEYNKDYPLRGPEWDPDRSSDDDDEVAGYSSQSDWSDEDGVLHAGADEVGDETSD